MPSDFPQQLWSALCGWWREQAAAKGALGASSLLLRELWGFVRDSTPARRRQRYGDMDYDWERRVNTTSATVGWRTRLLGVFHSPYQATDPALFREMMAALPIDFREFTFIDIGSGKGRSLLMASEYPFKKIVGVELLAELHRAAEENIRSWRSRTREAESVAMEFAGRDRHALSGAEGSVRATQSLAIESVLADAREFEFPSEPLVVYLFNPLPERALSEFLRRLEKSLEPAPRPLWVVYHNPLLEAAFGWAGFLEKAGGTAQYSVYRTIRIPK